MATELSMLGWDEALRVDLDEIMDDLDPGWATWDGLRNPSPAE